MSNRDKLRVTKEDLDNQLKTPWYANIYLTPTKEDNEMSEDRKPREPMRNDETVATYRVEATKAAKELGYDDKCLEEIKHAETKDAIANAVARGRHRLVKEEELLASCRRNIGVEKPTSDINNIIRKENEDMNTEKTFVPAGFGVDPGHIDRYQDTYIHSGADGNPVYLDERRQLDILQAECAELIKAVSKAQRMMDHSKGRPLVGRRKKDFCLRWHYARANLVEELAHVAISSSIVARILHVSQDEIDTEVKRKDNKLPKA